MKLLILLLTINLLVSEIIEYTPKNDPSKYCLAYKNNIQCYDKPKIKTQREIQREIQREREHDEMRKNMLNMFSQMFKNIPKE